MSGQIIVAGSINLDIVVNAPRHPRPGETLTGSSIHYNLGGKGANQAAAAAKLNVNGRTVMLGRVGCDPFGGKVQKELEAFGLETFLSVDPDVSTGTALITLAHAENTIVVIPGANGNFSDLEIDDAIIRDGAICVSQLEIPVASVEGFFKKARRNGAVRLLNAAPAPTEPIPELLQLTDILVVNETEAASTAGLPAELAAPEAIPKIAQAIGLSEPQTLVMTLGAEGCVALHEGKLIRVPGRKVIPEDTTGAGDCFAGALATAISQQMSMEAALTFANLAASICVTRPGAAASMPSMEEVMRIWIRDYHF